MRALGGITTVVICIATFGAGAAAQEDPALAEAKQHFDRGRELFRNGSYEEAIREFRAADKLRPSPILAYNIGLALEKLGRCKPAIDHFERYLREQPDADNRADTEQKIADQRAKIARGECAKQVRPPPGVQPTEPGGYTPPPAGGYPPPPAGYPPTTTAYPPPRTDVVPITQASAGMHPFSLGLRVGPIFGRLGNTCGPVGCIENAAGLQLRTGFTFPAATLGDGRTVLQMELFGAFIYYGFAQADFIGGVHLSSGNAKMPLFGVAGRVGIFPSRRIPLAIVPAAGVGVGAQMFSATTDRCEVSTTLATVVINLDLALRYELAIHHALYFSPADMYILVPPLADGDPIDLMCFGGTGMALPKDFFGLADAKLNYAIDFGYMYQF
ncbi:MAG TPA: tetratricopeptide repeat protein [Polyangia bacterium]|nr:tetratricopeptide repeat protein [Polyangia bacterium]